MLASIPSARSNKVRAASVLSLVNGSCSANAWPRMEIDGVGVLDAAALFRFRLDEFVAQRIGQSRHDFVLQLE